MRWSFLNCGLPCREFDASVSESMSTDNINASIPSPETQTANIGIAGMTCDNCAKRVDRALRGLPGVTDVTVDRARGTARVTYDKSVVGVPAMRDVLLKIGYQPVAPTS